MKKTKVQLEREVKRLQKQLAAAQTVIANMSDVARFQHNSYEPFQLLVNLKGKTKRYIREQLEEMLCHMDDTYGKPRPGIVLSSDGETDIVTRWWDGVRY
jgi:hypothetical protein